MKNLRTLFVCTGILLTQLCVHAQKQDHPVPVNQPDLYRDRLFQRLPDNIPVSITQLTGLLATPIGNSVNIELSDKSSLHFEGKVVSAAGKNGSRIQSIVIKSTNYVGANLTFSKTTLPDGTVSYSGRMVSFKHGDLLELKNQSGQFSFVKKNYYELVNE